MSEKEVENIDWSRIKSVLNSILATLQEVYNLLPPGLPKIIIGGIIAALQLLISLLPSLQGLS